MSKRFTKMAEILEKIKAIPKKEREEVKAKEETIEIDADVNKDGQVDEKDVDAVKKKVKKKKQAE